MAGNVVTILDTAQSTVRPAQDIGTNVEHGCLLLVLGQKVVKGIVRAVGTIIVGLDNENSVFKDQKGL